jgi:pSer/pThr/pTyr-binding forkhead associated (FHA) protein
MSLLTTGGESISHTSRIDRWLSTLNTSQVDARTAEPNIDTLNRAVAIASDQTPRPGMGRTVLFVTAPMEKLQSDALETTISQAREAGVAINIWLVASPGTANTQFAQQLKASADSTGGDFYIFAGDEIPPSPEIYFEQYRDIYAITYESLVRASGTHQVLVEVTVNTQAVKSPVQNFEIEILPPSPVFVSPPMEIVRKPPPENKKEKNEEHPYLDFLPKTQVLEIVIDFPDGRLRPIVKSSLYVDDELAIVITQPPFDKFVWDLSSYSSNETHSLQVRVEDAFGLIGESGVIPINVLIQVPQQKPLETLKNNTPLLTGLIALLAGIILLLVLVLGGRLTPRLPGALRRRRLNADPVTQPVPVHEEPTQPIRRGLSDRLKLRKKVFPPSAIALLSRLSEDDTTIDATPIPITSDKTTFGTDPKRVTIVLDDPSVDPLHARLTREPDDSFRLADMNTIAGTWINYTPVSTSGARIEHGDLIHIGRVGFRFLLRKPPTVHISVEPLTAESESEDQNINDEKAK